MGTLLRSNEWPFRWARPPVSQSMPVSKVYVHHTAGAHAADPKVAFHALNEDAISRKGYSATDYSILVHRSGSGPVTIGEARGQWTPAATLDENTDSKAVVLMGYFHPGHDLSRHPTDPEVHGVAEAIRWMIGQGWVTPDAVILGHRDNPDHPGATSCPGDFLYARMEDIRTLVYNPFPGPWPGYKNKPILRWWQHPRGDAVRYLQWVLVNRCGKQLPINGVYNKATRRGVQDLRRFFGLKRPRSTVCGPSVWDVVDFLAER